MFSSCYHAFLGVAILFSSKGAKSSKHRLWLPESIYKERKFRNLILDPFYAFSGERLHFVFHPKWSEFSATSPMATKNAFQRND
jgi:hypothetical protein